VLIEFWKMAENETRSPEDAEAAIAKHLPKIYAYLKSQTLAQFDWVEISEDFDELRWLDKCQRDGVISAIWDMIMKNAKALLTGQPRYNILDINRVRLDIFDVLRLIVIGGDKAYSLPYECKRKVAEMTIFTDMATALSNLEDEALFARFSEVHDVYRWFRS
jgi:hypothetical protein